MKASARKGRGFLFMTVLLFKLRVDHGITSIKSGKYDKY